MEISPKFGRVLPRLHNVPHFNNTPALARKMKNKLYRDKHIGGVAVYELTKLIAPNNVSVVRLANGDFSNGLRPV
ncbi:hypothetical protein FACS1894207_0520 [Bacteroidia bacterium]|nr:hypothetical protein FACS1894207_0520 [Bacteroidia bacterium]